MGMKKVINTILKTIKTSPATVENTVMVTTKPERFAVDMPLMPVARTFQTPITFTWNVEPVSTQRRISISNIQHGGSALYFAVVIGRDFEKYASRQLLLNRRKWKKKEYRHAYMQSAIEQGIAWQIKINRERRSMSQSTLAEAIGSKQSAISRAEDPSYGRHSLDTLVKIANTFDCALQVKFVPYSKLARDSHDLSAEALYAPSYSEEI